MCFMFYLSCLQITNPIFFCPFPLQNTSSITTFPPFPVLLKSFANIGRSSNLIMATTKKITDAFKSHPVHIPVHKNLDFDSFQELPDSYAWIQPATFPSLADTDSDFDTVPLIDLSLSNVAHHVANACSTWGAFQVINHGISTSLLDRLESAANSLFSLPLHHKLKAARSPDGVTGYGLVRISSFFPKRMWSEGFTIVGSPLDHFRQLWPNDYTEYCDTMREYEREMKSLCGRLIWMALGELGITREDMKWAGPNGDFQASHSVTQFNSYPICPDPDRAMGLGVHTDTSLLTVVYQNNTRGLQVLREGKRWVTVEPVPSGLVVHVGDLLHILTNGLYPSVLHQAVVNRTRKRLSVAYVFGPPESAEISPLKKLLGPTQPPLYRPVTWSEYLGTKAKHFNDALSSVRLCAPLTSLLDINDHSSVTVG
ncbi:gibberellin 3-beta-dioxygenase 1-like [Momordica charantia]|uniref:gibberellin 3beta-dioxygenase n=1 Tax=Momordica charantia TaxID=3673 RepID=A0A6J1CVL5_MOMCH|nr:gibberellin 3-beta-dioxygenase 1-like [Momordica charantia]